jgi:hypothetical protein
MYSAIVKIVRAFFESVLLTFCAVLLVAVAMAASSTIFELFRATGHLTPFFERVFYRFGGF